MIFITVCISWNNKKCFDTIDAQCKHEDEYGAFMEWHGGRYPEDEEPGCHSIATRLWLDIWGIVVGISAGARDSLHQRILTGFGSHHMSYSVSTSIYFPASTVAEVKNVWPYTSATHIPLWHVEGNFTFPLNLVDTNQCTSSYRKCIGWCELNLMNQNAQWNNKIN
jgi:hypothetical protein